MRYHIDYELELQRRDVTPAQFLAYVRSMCRKHDICFDMSAKDFADDSQSNFNCHYTGGTPNTRPAWSETVKMDAYDKQTYVCNYDGSLFNEIIEFEFDDEKTGHGYFYTVNRSVDDIDAHDNMMELMEISEKLKRNEIEALQREIKKAGLIIAEDRGYYEKWYINMQYQTIERRARKIAELYIIIEEIEEMRSNDNSTAEAAAEATAEAAAEATAEAAAEAAAEATAEAAAEAAAEATAEAEINDKTIYKSA